LIAGIHSIRGLLPRQKYGPRNLQDRGIALEKSVA